MEPGMPGAISGRPRGSRYMATCRGQGLGTCFRISVRYSCMKDGFVVNLISCVSGRSRWQFAVRLYTRSFRGSMGLAGKMTYRIGKYVLLHESSRGVRMCG